MADEKKFLDQTGVQFLWSKLSMEDYPNNETLIAILNAIDETKADKNEVNNLLNGKVNTSELNNYYTKTEVEQFHDEITDYVDDEVAALVNAAPETLDTLGELATAFAENKAVVDALDASITNKQDKISDTLILVDTITGKQHKIQIQNGQLVSFPVE